MADIKSIQVDGIDYAIKDESARSNIGDLSQLATEAKGDLVSALNELSANAGSGSSPIQRVESLDESNLKNLRDLTTGSYVLYGYFRPYAGASSYLPFDNLLVNVYHVDEGSHLFEFSTANSEVNFIEILVDSTADSGFTYSRTAISMLELNGLIGKLGNLNELATTEKGSVVAAINEVAASGGSGSGSSVQADMAQNDPDQPDYVKNRTHWVEGNQTVIEWDGSTEGREVIEADFYSVVKISDLVPAFSEFTNGKVIANGVESDLADVTFIEADGYYGAEDLPLMVATESNVIAGDVTLPSPGVYHLVMSGLPICTRITYGSTTYHPLDEAFIPDTIARSASSHGLTVADAAGEATTAAEFNALLAVLREAGYLAT